MSNITSLAEVKKEQKECKRNLFIMMKNTLQKIVELEVISETFLDKELPIHQLRNMEENIKQLMLQAHKEDPDFLNCI